MSDVVIKLKVDKVFNGKIRKAGTPLLKGGILGGVEPFKVINAIRLGETTLEVPVKPQKEKDKK